MPDAYLKPLLSRDKGFILCENIENKFGRSCSFTYPLINENVTKEQIIFIKAENIDWLITDLSNLYGTFLNGKRIRPQSPHILQENDIIFSNPYLFKFSLDQNDFNNCSHLTEENDRIWCQYIKNMKNISQDLDCSRDEESKINSNQVSDDDYYPAVKKAKPSSEAIKQDKCILGPTKSSCHLSPHYSFNYLKLINQLKAEITANNEYILIINKEADLKKVQYELERKEFEQKIKSDYDIKYRETENSISSLQESQTSLIQQLASVQNSKTELLQQLDQSNQTLQNVNKNLSEKREEIEVAAVCKAKLEEDLAKSTREVQELQKRLDESFLRENKLMEEKRDMTNKIKNTLENDLQCIICQEILIKATVLKCSHMFCNLCLDTWLKTKRQCPVCRKAFKEGSLFKCPVLGVDNYIDNITEATLDREAKDKRKDVKLTRAKVQASFKSSSTNSRHNRVFGEPSTSNAWNNDSIIAEYLNLALNRSSVMDPFMLNINGAGTSIGGRGSRNVGFQIFGRNDTRNSSTNRRQRRRRGTRELVLGMDVPPPAPRLNSRNQVPRNTRSRETGYDLRSSVGNLNTIEDRNSAGSMNTAAASTRNEVILLDSIAGWEDDGTEIIALNDPPPPSQILPPSNSPLYSRNITIDNVSPLATRRRNLREQLFPVESDDDEVFSPQGDSRYHPLLHQETILVGDDESTISESVSNVSGEDTDNSLSISFSREGDDVFYNNLNSEIVHVAQGLPLDHASHDRGRRINVSNNSARNRGARNNRHLPLPTTTNSRRTNQTVSRYPSRRGAASTSNNNHRTSRGAAPSARNCNRR